MSQTQWCRSIVTTAQWLSLEDYLSLRLALCAQQHLWRGRGECYINNVSFQIIKYFFSHDLVLLGHFFIAEEVESSKQLNNATKLTLAVH